MIIMRKIFYLKWVVVMLVVASPFIQSCAPFKTLQKKPESISSVIGTYKNDCDSTDSWREKKLWQLIDPKYSTEKDSLLVRFEITNRNKLKAFLIDDSVTIAEKIIKGKFKEDNCYYTKRVFYVVPVLPVFFLYENNQDRILTSGNYLVYETTFNSAGAFIIMAGGNKGNYQWLYKRIED